MANSQLLGKKFKLHPMVLEQINLALKKYGNGAKNLRGFKRAAYILEKTEKDPTDGLPLLTYEATKRIYHDMSSLDMGDKSDQVSYDLIGGDFMKAWCIFELKKAREEVKSRQNARQDAGLSIRDKDIDDEDMTKPTIDPTNTQDDRYLKPQALEEAVLRIKTLMKKIL